MWHFKKLKGDIKAYINEASITRNVIPLKLPGFLITIFQTYQFVLVFTENHTPGKFKCRRELFSFYGACEFILIFKVMMGER